MIMAAVVLILNLLPGLLQSLGVVSPAMSKLISQLASAIPTLITDLAAGKTKSDDVQAALAAMRTELQALSQDTNLNPHALGTINTLILGISNALLGYQNAEVSDDPSTLIPLPTDVEPPAQTASSAATPVGSLSSGGATPAASSSSGGATPASSSAPAPAAPATQQASNAAAQKLVEDVEKDVEKKSEESAQKG